MKKLSFKVLLIDDDEDEYVNVKYLLTRVNTTEYHLDWADSYDDGLNAISRLDYDAALIDYRLGGRDGLDLLRQVVETGLDIPVVLLTGKGEYRVDLEAMEVGASDYLDKGQINPDILDRSLRYSIKTKRNELELKKYRHHLEEIVSERTCQLEEKSRQLQVTNQFLEAEIAERTKAEEALKSANRDLEQTAALLKAANREIESFWFSISHDLRAPLVAIEGFSRIIVDDYADKLDEEGRESLAFIRNNTAHMGRLIDDLLAFSQLGYQEMRFAEIDMDRMAAQTFNELSQAAPERNIQFQAGALPPVVGDPVLLRQVFSHLIGNAIKYTRPRASALIQAEGMACGDENIYSIRDNGVGFDMKQDYKLFGVFQRLHSADEFEGTGVGLASVQRIVHRHGGRVWAEGKTGEGAAFHFALPASGKASSGRGSAVASPES